MTKERLDFGKWSVKGFPHKDWVCTDVIDLGGPVGTCEMCEKQTIRYAHIMRHPDQPDELACGCVCAAAMEKGKVGGKAIPSALDAARKRESKLKSDVKKFGLEVVNRHKTLVAVVNALAALPLDTFNRGFVNSMQAALSRGISSAKRWRTTKRKAHFKRICNNNQEVVKNILMRYF